MTVDVWTVNAETDIPKSLEAGADQRLSESHDKDSR